MFKYPVEESSTSSSFPGLDHHVHSGIYPPAFLPSTLSLDMHISTNDSPILPVIGRKPGSGRTPAPLLWIRISLRYKLCYSVTWEDEILKLISLALLGVFPFPFSGEKRQVSAGRASLVSHGHMTLPLRLCFFQGTQTKRNPM